MLRKEKTNIKQEIDNYIDRQLSAEETEDLWSHIIQEEEYVDYLNVAANVKALDAPEGAVPAHYLKQLVYAGAAVALILIVVFAVIRMGGNNFESSVQPITAIELPFQRSAEMPANISEHDKIIRDAVLLYYNGAYEKSVNTLQNELISTNDARWKSRLNITIGIFYYNSNKFEKAKSAFQSVISTNESTEPLLLEKAYWYLGNTLYQLNNVARAQEAMRKVIEIDGAYSRLAQKNLDEK